MSEEQCVRPRGKRARGFAGAAWLVGFAVFGAGCGSGSGTPTVASLPGHGSSRGTAARLTQAQSDRDMVAFAGCMRAHGVPMSDPYHRRGHAGLSMDMPTQDAASAPAFAVCTHLIKPIIEAKLQAGAALAAPTLGALTTYAECMRNHDIAMLDPNPQGALNLGNVPGITDNFGRYSAQFRTADAACRHLLPPGVHDDGTGP